MQKSSETKSRRLTVLVCAILLILSLNTIPISTTHTIAKTNTPLSTILYVGGNGTGNYTQIQKAINNATSGDIIYIYNGTYTEYLTINKTLSLQGESQENTTIQGNNTGNILTIQANNCTITQLTIQKGQIGIQLHSSNNAIHNTTIKSHQIRGITILNTSTNNTFNNNIFSTNKIQGLLLDNTHYHTISYNHFTNHTTIALSLLNSNHINIHNNTFINNKQPIILQNSHNTEIHHNSLDKNIDTISLFNTQTSTINHNNFQNNSKGLVIHTSNNNTVQYNTFLTTNLYAIKIQQNSDNNTLTSNNIKKSNDTGILLLPSKSTTIQHNQITHCYIAIKTENNEKTNTITHNTINQNHIGLHVTSSRNLIIEENHIHNNTYGIQTDQSHQLHIKQNTITQNQNKGIQLTRQSHNITLQKNTITSNRDGILIKDSHTIHCTENSIQKNTNYGTQIDNSTNSTITDNIIQENKDGLYLTHTTIGTITHNTITRNTLTGITLWFSNEFNINNNTFETNSIAIKLISSTINHIIYNTIQDHTTGILSQAGSTNNILYHNTFTNNIQHAYDANLNTWNHNYPSGGNYWDDYTGIDNDLDGIGDTPYDIQGGISQDKYPLLDKPGPKNLTIHIQTGLGLKIIITNTGTTPLYQTNINYIITGGILQRINKQQNHQRPQPLPVNHSHTITLYPLGIGPLTINITSEALNTKTITHQTTARIFLIFTF